MPISKKALRELSNRVLATPNLVRQEPDCQFVVMPNAVPAIEEVLLAWGQRMVSRATELRYMPIGGQRPASQQAKARGGALKLGHIRVAANDMWNGKTQPPQRVDWVAKQPTDPTAAGRGKKRRRDAAAAAGSGSGSGSDEPSRR